MYKKLLFIFVLFSSFLFSQNNTVTFANSLKTTSTDLKDAIPIVNQKNDNVSIFLMDSKKVYGYLFDGDFNIKKELSSEKRSRKYKKIIGYSISETNDYRLFLASHEDDKFATVNFSYENNTSSLQELDLKLNKEFFLQTVVYNNTFYLITIIKGSSILVFYKFNGNGNFEKNMVDLTNKRFINLKDKTVKLYKLFTSLYVNTLTGRYEPNEIKKIEEGNPNPIELTSEYTKMYLRNNTVIFTLDNNRNYTQIITIDLNTFSANVKQMQKPFIAIKKAIKKTNSYLFGDYVFMIAATPTQLSFTVQDYKTGEHVKKYFITSKDSITFKNTPFTQTNGKYDDYYEMENTKKFLHKIRKQNIGISVNQDQNNYHITLGGKNEYVGNGIPTTMSKDGFSIASFGYFNPTFFAYSSYTNTKSIYFTSLFDENFNHVKGKVPENIFNKIENFKEDFNTSTNGETVFRYKDYYFYGHYKSSSKEYTLVKIKG